MKYDFKLANFPNSNFDIKVSMLTGKYILRKDGIEIERSKEERKPFLIPNINGGVLKAYPIQKFPDLVPNILEIDGIKYNIISRLKLYQYIIGGIPFVLIIVGGLIGGVIGYLGTMISYDLFRQKGSETVNVIKVVGIVIVTAMLWFVIAAIFVNK
jgi:hypothetical protein